MPYSLRILFAKCGLKMATIGYARVSTRDQNLTGQIDALKAAGAVTIFREKVSGARADRPQLAKLMAGLRAGDVVAVSKLDRLGRSTRELLDLIDRIGKAGASVSPAARRLIVSALWPPVSDSAASVPFARRPALGYIVSARPVALDALGLHR
jgi:Resolvase, N terminal domain